jgi:Flp pilus assembly protein TadG
MLNRRRRERGQDLIEYALILPVLLLLIFGVVELALIFFSYNTISDAAREAARWGVIVDAGVYRTEPNIEAKAREVTEAARLYTAVPAATVDTTANTVRVVVTYEMDPIAPIIGFPKITLRAVSTKQIELE